MRSVKRCHADARARNVQSGERPASQAAMYNQAMSRPVPLPVALRQHLLLHIARGGNAGEAAFSNFLSRATVMTMSSDDASSFCAPHSEVTLVAEFVEGGSYRARSRWPTVGLPRRRHASPSASAFPRQSGVVHTVFDSLAPVLHDERAARFRRARHVAASSDSVLLVAVLFMLGMYHALMTLPSAFSKHEQRNPPSPAPALAHCTRPRGVSSSIARRKPRAAVAFTFISSASEEAKKNPLAPKQGHLRAKAKNVHFPHDGRRAIATSTPSTRSRCSRRCTSKEFVREGHTEVRDGKRRALLRAKRPVQVHQGRPERRGHGGETEPQYGRKSRTRFDFFRRCNVDTVNHPTRVVSDELRNSLRGRPRHRRWDELRPRHTQ